MESPHDVMVLRGSPATLDCRYGSHPYSVRWWRDGDLMDLDMEEQDCLLLPDGSLFFLTTRMEDTGRYQCEVTAEEGIFNSKTALLTVFDNQKEDILDVLYDEDILDVLDDEDIVLKESESDIELVPENPPVPLITSSYLLSPVTGYISWVHPLTTPDAYLLLILANNTPLTNLTVDRHTSQVQLTPLSPDMVYSVRIASLCGQNVSQFSPPAQLDTMDTPMDMENTIWAMSIIMVVVITLSIIGMATCIFHRIKKWNKARDISAQHDAAYQHIIFHQPSISHHHQHSTAYPYPYHPWTVPSIVTEGTVCRDVLMSNHYAYSNIVTK